MADQPKVVRVECATYGATGSAHGLITSSLPREQLPPDLAGMVDKPPHHPDDALPLLACSPVGPFFAIWRTLDDTGAMRRGMVRSHVALVRLEAISALNDLAGVSQRLPSRLADQVFGEAFELTDADASVPAPTPRYDSLCELLVRSDRQRPVIVPDEGDWDELLATLWSFLWRDARARLTCLHAAGPEAQPATTPTILVTPRSALNKWTGYPIVDRPTQVTDAARLLRGDTSAALVHLQRQLGGLPGDVRMLGLMERAAHLFQRFESGSISLPELKVLLETIVRLAPMPSVALELKNRVAERLGAQLCGATAKDVLSLANLDVELSGVLLAPAVSALRAWVGMHLARADASQVATVVRRLADGRYVAWWREAIRDGVQELFGTTSRSVWEAVWSWTLQHPEVFGDLLREAAVSDRLEAAIAGACPRSLPESVASAAITVSHSRQWPSLHGAVVAAALKPSEAYTRQAAFPTRWRDGLTTLLDRLDGRDIVELAISFDDDELCRRAAGAVAAAPGLLGSLDVASPAWREIWRRAIVGGLPPWVGIGDPESVAQELLEKVAAGDPVDPDLLVRLGTELPTLRKSVPLGFWANAAPRVRTTIARALGKQWLAVVGEAATEAPAAAALPEILSVFMEQVSAKSFRVEFLPRILDLTNERTFARVFLDGPPITVPPAVAREVGLRIRKWDDASIALAAFRRWNLWSGWKDLEPLLIECAELLDRWDRWKLPSRHAPSEADVHLLFIELRQIACDLYPEGPPEHLWEDAGGKAWALPKGNTGEQSWAQSLSMTERGARGAPRADRLIEHMRNAFAGGARAERLEIIQRWLSAR